MKKILLAGVVLLMSVGCAHAAGTKWTGGSAAPAPALTGENLTSALNDFKVSNGVTLDCVSGGTSYNATAYHLQGTRVFAASSGDTLLRYAEKTAGQVPTAVATTSNSGDFSSWSAL